MLKSNCSHLKVWQVYVILIMIVMIFLSGMVLNKKSNSNFFSVVRGKDIVIQEKELKIDVEDTLLAYNDNINLNIKAATASEKIASRALVSRRERGETDNYIPISDVTISRNMDLNIKTGLSRDDFITLMTNCRADTSGFFEQNAGLIYDLCQIYNINEIFFCGLISAESGWNIAPNHRSTHNYISLMSGGGLIHFSSVEEGLEAAAKALHNNYLTPGGRFYRGSNLEGVRTIFCPVNPGWTSLVYGRMEQII